MVFEGKISLKWVKPCLLSACTANVVIKPDCFVNTVTVLYLVLEANTMSTVHLKIWFPLTNQSYFLFQRWPFQVTSQMACLCDWS